MNLQAIKSSVMKFIKDEEGLTIVEYAVAGGLITLAVVAAFANLGTEISASINKLCGIVKGGEAGAACT